MAKRFHPRHPVAELAKDPVVDLAKDPARPGRLATSTTVILVMLMQFAVVIGCSSDTTPTESNSTDTVEQADAMEQDETATKTADNQPDESTEPAEPTSSQPQISAAAFRKAAYDGRLEMVRTAIESGMDIESKEPDGDYTALHMAAFNGHTETVKLLIENGAQVDPRDHESKTPLLHACTGPFASTVKVLIEAGADVNAKEGTESFTPLMTAAALGQPEIVQLLLDNGADKTVADDDNDKAIDHARNEGQTEIVKMLE